MGRQEAGIPRALAGRLRQERLHRGWSQTHLAERMGVVQSLISAWESGHRKPNIGHTKALAQHLGVPVLHLLSGTGRLPDTADALLPELRWYGLDVPGKPVPAIWAARPVEEVLAAALQHPEPQIINPLPALLFLHRDLSGDLAFAHARTRREVARSLTIYHLQPRQAQKPLHRPEWISRTIYSRSAKKPTHHRWGANHPFDSTPPDP